MPHMDPGVMADPSSVPGMASQPMQDHGMTPAYSDDTSAAPIDQSAPAPDSGMHFDMGGTSPAPASPTPSSASDDDLLAIKQDALGALAPLVGQLEQSPEEKFRTTMMMIQASDDRSLVKAAYEAAQAIADEKVRAQALLDVVNEINYFTSHNS